MAFPANTPMGTATVVEHGRKPSRQPGAAKGMTPSSWSFSLRLPVRIVSEANQRCHWAERKRRGDAQKAAVICALTNSPFDYIFDHGLLRITLTHIGRKMDSDNLAGGFKAIRDAIARWLGRDDGDDSLDWRYTQERGQPGIEIKLEPQS